MEQQQNQQQKTEQCAFDDKIKITNDVAGEGTPSLIEVATSVSCDDSSSTTSSSFDTETSLIDTQNGIKSNNGNGKGKGMLFTDGMYIYGPYEFDLFTNVFYQSYDAELERANDDETKILQYHDNENRIPNNVLLKNHDDDNNSAMLQDKNKNNNNNNNCSSSINEKVDDERDEDTAKAFHRFSCDSEKDVEVNGSDNDERDLIEWNSDDDEKYFNYVHKTNDNNLIDEGSSSIGNDVSKKLTQPDHETHSTNDMTISKVPLIMHNVATAITQLDSFEQFNYDKNEIAPPGIAQCRTRYVLVPLIIKCQCSKITSNNVENVDNERNQSDDASNKIRRLNEHEISEVNDNCCANARDEMKILW